MHVGTCRAAKEALVHDFQDAIAQPLPPKLLTLPEIQTAHAGGCAGIERDIDKKTAHWGKTKPGVRKHALTDGTHCLRVI